MLSLTKEEFMGRLLARSQLLRVAVDEDVRKIFPSALKIMKTEAGISLDLTGPVTELLLKVMMRVINLVYEESLD